MSSFTRRLQRKHLRAGTFTTDEDGKQVHVKHEPRPQFTETRGDGYLTVRYTRGPRLVSGKRLRAQGRLAEIQHPGAMRQQNAAMARAIAGIQRASENAKRIADLEATPVASISRQVRRNCLRTGRELPPLIGAAPKRVRKSRAKPAQATAA